MIRKPDAMSARSYAEINANRHEKTATLNEQASAAYARRAVTRPPAFARVCELLQS
jgi:hypothetical protein